jgi:hypothetical protein
MLSFATCSYHLVTYILTSKSIGRVIRRSLLSAELEELERNRVAVRARVLAARSQRFFSGHRSSLSGSAAGSSSAPASSVAASDDDDDDDNGFVARGGTESPFRAEGGGEEEDDDMEDAGGGAASSSGWGVTGIGAAGLNVGSGSAATVVASSSAVPVRSVLGRPFGTGTVVFKRYVRV